MLHAWYQTYESMINEKTVNPSYPYQSPAWWYTHDRLRKAYRLLERLARQDCLFTYLNTDKPSLDEVLSSTNRLEGGPNKAIRRFLLLHPGLSEQHMRCGIEWILQNLTEFPVDIEDFLYSWAKDHETGKENEEQADEQINNENGFDGLPGWGSNPNELNIHYGWAGRT